MGPLARLPQARCSQVEWYRAYGRQLASELLFPELRATPAGTPDWTFRVGPPAVPPGQPEGPPLGEQPLYGEIKARLYRTATGHRVVVDDTGTYDLTDHGRTIIWRSLPEGTADFARAHFLGRVLATALHFEGALVLHGSAVSFQDRGVVFLAPKHTGKSTLALALAQGGARLISDDTILVSFRSDTSPLVWPGVPSLRLLPDTAAHLGFQVQVERREDGKHLAGDLPPELIEEKPRTLDTVYLLAAAESIRDNAAVARRRIEPPLAAAAMVGQGKISEMLGPGEAPVLLQRAARVAARVPVYQLAVLRDLSRMSEVVEQLAEWHGPLGAEE